VQKVTLHRAAVGHKTLILNLNRYQAITNKRIGLTLKSSTKQ
jgi:hypothetical protein